MVGAVSSALVIGVILLVLNDVGTVYSQKNLPQPANPPDVSQARDSVSRPRTIRPSYYVWYVDQAEAEVQRSRRPST